MDKSSEILAPKTHGSALVGPNGPISLNATYYQGQRVVYGRETNETWEQLEEALGSLEGGHALIYSSGQAAIHAAISSVGPSSTLYVGEDTYNGTRRLAALLEQEGRLSWRSVSSDELSAHVFLKGAKEGDVLIFESPSNPALNIYDIATVARACREAGVTTVFDNTFSTPLLQCPLQLGVDVVVHSTTKFIGGHSDALGGAVVIADGERYNSYRLRRTLFGPIPGPFEAFLTLRGLKSLSPRLRVSCESAIEAARFLVSRFGEGAVRYPGLPSDPGHAIASRQMKGFGAIVTLDLGSQGRAETFLGALRLFHLATSLGGVESLAERRQKHTFEDGIPPGLIRLSIGVEATLDVLEDLERGAIAVDA